jgi:hypothetical protein
MKTISITNSTTLPLDRLEKITSVKYDMSSKWLLHLTPSQRKLQQIRQLDNILEKFYNGAILSQNQTHELLENALTKITDRTKRAFIDLNIITITADIETYIMDLQYRTDNATETTYTTATLYRLKD